MFHRYFYKKGMTLIEIMIAVAVLGSCILPIVAVLSQGTSSSVMNEAEQHANNYCRNILEVLLAPTFKFDEIVDGEPSSLSPNIVAATNVHGPWPTQDTGDTIKGEKGTIYMFKLDVWNIAKTDLKFSYLKNPRFFIADRRAINNYPELTEDAAKTKKTLGELITDCNFTAGRWEAKHPYLNWTEHISAGSTSKNKITIPVSDLTGNDINMKKIRLTVEWYRSINQSDILSGSGNKKSFSIITFKTRLE